MFEDYFFLLRFEYRVTAAHRTAAPMANHRAGGILDSLLNTDTDTGCR